MNKLEYSHVLDTARLLNVGNDELLDFSVNNPRVYGTIVDATVIRLTQEEKQKENVDTV